MISRTALITLTLVAPISVNVTVTSLGPAASSAAPAAGAATAAAATTPNLSSIALTKSFNPNYSAAASAAGSSTASAGASSADFTVPFSFASANALTVIANLITGAFKVEANLANIPSLLGNNANFWIVSSPTTSPSTIPVFKTNAS